MRRRRPRRRLRELVRAAVGPAAYLLVSVGVAAGGYYAPLDRGDRLILICACAAGAAWLFGGIVVELVEDLVLRRRERGAERAARLLAPPPLTVDELDDDRLSRARTEPPG